MSAPAVAQVEAADEARLGRETVTVTLAPMVRLPAERRLLPPAGPDPVQLAFDFLAGENATIGLDQDTEL